MSDANHLLTDARPKTVGSFGNPADLRAATPSVIRESCDIAEIRLDLMLSESGENGPPPWQHLDGIPLLFTARRLEEGGALALSAEERCSMLLPVLDQAAVIDIEVASIPEMGELIKILKIRDIPWVASFHNFENPPDPAVLTDAADTAKSAGAGAFKVAARIHTPADLAGLADFQLADHGLPVATMGMGPLAPVSRLLCAQCGSILNYGFLGTTPTAPGQWDAALLRKAIAALAPLTS